MLATLVGYKEQSYYEEHPTLNLYTPYGDYTVEVFSGVIVSGAKDFLEFNFDDEAAFEAYWQPFYRKLDIRMRYCTQAGRPAYIVYYLHL